MNSATSVSPAAKKPRFEEIDVMRGMAIFFVVLGHIVAHGDYPQGSEWYRNLSYWIYHFHMPLFMYLSGLTFFLFQKPITNLPAYRRFLTQRASRLLPALFIIGAVVVIVKYSLSGWVHIDNPVRDVWTDLLKLVYDPLGGVLVSVWFVYTLFVIYVVVVPLLLAFKWTPLAALVAGIIVHFVPLPDYFCLSRVGEYLFMFGLGCCAAVYYKQILDFSARYFPAFACLFLIISVLIFVFMDDWAEDFKKVMLSLASVPVAHALSVKLRGSLARTLSLLGICSFIIYLLNTEFIGITKAVLLKVHSWDGAAFLLFLPVLLVAGTFGPVILKRRFFSRYAWLDRFTG
jgi:peptidoglycan/LPS O-acetylase OafA/YrhL